MPLKMYKEHFNGKWIDEKSQVKSNNCVNVGPQHLSNCAYLKEEQTKKMERQTQELLLQKWEPPLPEPRGEEPPLLEPRGEELPLLEPRGEELGC
ncbi:UNVERIFIED_CONTAM: hypothetical protein FKN15_011672 [Acipenser sinensis]